MITFTISLLAHNECELTRQCLQSLLPSLTDEVQLILVDNGSTDSTPAVFAEFRNEHPQFQIGILDMKENSGFIAAHNRACSYARGSYFVVLNNDIGIHDPDWLENVRAKFLSDSKIAIVGAAGNCNTLASDGRGYFTQEKMEQPDYVEGSILAIRTSLAKKHHLFGSDYRFGYCEDADLSLRLRERGWKIVNIPIKHRHDRFKTYVNTKDEIDLEGFDALNHMKFSERWGYFLKNKHFGYRIAVRRNGARGDVLLATPIIRALKERFGHAKIDFFTDHPEILYRNPHLDNVFTGTQANTVYDSGDYEVRFDLNESYERNPKVHIVQAYAETCNVDCGNWQPAIYPRSEEMKKFQRGVMRHAVFHVGPTAWAGRNWSPAKFDQVSKWLIEKGWQVTTVGNETTSAISCHTDMRGSTTVEELAVVIQNADLFVGLDSLPMHLAACAMIPTVAVFGCVDPKYRLMPWSFVKGIQAKNVSCLGCHHERLGPKFSCECLRPSVECMNRLEVDQVISAIEEVLKNKMVSLETSKIRQRVMPFVFGDVIDLGCSRDPIESGCTACDQHPYPEVTNVVDIAGELPFADEQFGTVYSSHALEDMDDPSGVLREWVRILRPGGHLILYVPHKVLYPATGMTNCDHKVDGFLPEELEAMAAKLGLVTVLSEIDSGLDRYSCFFVARKDPKGIVTQTA